MNDTLTGCLIGLLVAAGIILAMPLVAAESISLASWLAEAGALTSETLETTP